MKDDIAERGSLLGGFLAAMDPIWGQELTRLARELEAYKDTAKFAARLSHNPLTAKKYCRR